MSQAIHIQPAPEATEELKPERVQSTLERHGWRYDRRTGEGRARFIFPSAGVARVFVGYAASLAEAIGARPVLALIGGEVTVTLGAERPWTDTDLAYVESLMLQPAEGRAA